MYEGSIDAGLVAGTVFMLVSASGIWYNKPMSIKTGSIVLGFLAVAAIIIVLRFGLPWQGKSQTAQFSFIAVMMGIFYLPCTWSRKFLQRETGRLAIKRDRLNFYCT